MHQRASRSFQGGKRARGDLGYIVARPPQTCAEALPCPASPAPYAAETPVGAELRGAATGLRQVPFQVEATMQVGQLALGSSIVLGLLATLASSQTPTEQRLQPVSYVAEWQVKRGMEQAYVDLIDEIYTPVFSRLMSGEEPVIMGWGVRETFLHHPDGPTHSVERASSRHAGPRGDPAPYRSAVCRRGISNSEARQRRQRP